MKRREVLGSLAILPASLVFGMPGLSPKSYQGIVKEVVIDKHLTTTIPYIDYIFHFKKQRCRKCGQNGEYQLAFFQ